MPVLQAQSVLHLLNPETLQRANALSLLGYGKLFILQQLLYLMKDVPGDVAELGVYRGGSAYLIAKTMNEIAPDVTTYLFDTFTGLPDNSQFEIDHHQYGDFADCSLEQVRESLRDCERVKYMVGNFIELQQTPETIYEREKVKERWNTIPDDQLQDAVSVIEELGPAVAEELFHAINILQQQTTSSVLKLNTESPFGVTCWTLAALDALSYGGRVGESAGKALWDLQYMMNGFLDYQTLFTFYHSELEPLTKRKRIELLTERFGPRSFDACLLFEDLERVRRVGLQLWKRLRFSTDYQPLLHRPDDYRFRLVHVDADLYESTMAALQFFCPRMSKGGVMVFDDYQWHHCEGVKRAMEEYFAGDTVTQVDVYQDYQGVILFE